MKILLVGLFLITGLQSNAFAGTAVHHVKRLDTSAVENQTGLVIIEYSLAHCGICAQVSPTVEMIAEDLGQQVTIYEIDSGVTLEGDVVQGYPQFDFYVDGVRKEIRGGNLSYSFFANWIKRNSNE